MTSFQQFRADFERLLDGRDGDRVDGALGVHRPDVYRPLAFSLEVDECDDFLALCRQRQLMVCDQLVGQLREWIACSADSLTGLDDAAIDARVRAELETVNGQALAYGTWFYYPWRHRMVHLLSRESFATVRSNRNRNKITRSEQQRLRQARVGVVGLSVGHAVAMVLAQEGLCGQLRLADFDVLELSNLNRLRTTVFNLGVPKATIAARDVAEIDPYLDVQVFPDGVDQDNVDRFIGPGGGAAGGLDVVVEECDSLHVKLLVRERARARGVPVVMDTNDRGLLDIERFDREPERPILHGLLGDLDHDRARELAPNERLDLFSAFFGGRDRMSERFRQSLDLLGRELLGASQLASDVHLGAALVANAVRRIALGQLQGSGRYTIDLESLICD